jgi:hypothetical protein
VAVEATASIIAINQTFMIVVREGDRVMLGKTDTLSGMRHLAVEYLLVGGRRDLIVWKKVIALIFVIVAYNPVHIIVRRERVVLTVMIVRGGVFILTCTMSGTRLQRIATLSQSGDPPGAEVGGDNMTDQANRINTLHRNDLANTRIIIIQRRIRKMWSLMTSFILMRDCQKPTNPTLRLPGQTLPCHPRKHQMM